MHKKLEAELQSLANSILQLEKNSDINVLHEKSRKVYEKLTILKFVNTNLETGFTEVEEVKASEEEIEKETNFAAKEVVIEANIKEEIEVKESTQITEDLTPEEPEEIQEEVEVRVEEKEVLTEENAIEAILELDNEVAKDDVRDVAKMQFTLEDEMKDAISADVATDLFEKATKENPVVEKPAAPVTDKKRSLNDAIFNGNIQVGLNDRIAFVKNLFDGSQEDFNRVLSQLNSFDTEEDAKGFIQNFVKPDYNWDGKEEYEERLNVLIERKFL